MRYLLGTLSYEDSMKTCSDELDYFQNEPALDPDSNPMEWWKRNEERFPKLSRITKQLMCIPATSVPSERIFSVSGNIASDKRSRLKPENIDMLVFLHKNLPPL